MITIRKRWFEIFGEKEQEELKESHEQSKRNKDPKKEKKTNIFLINRVFI